MVMFTYFCFWPKVFFFGVGICSKKSKLFEASGFSLLWLRQKFIVATSIVNDPVFNAKETMIENNCIEKK